MAQSAIHNPQSAIEELKAYMVVDAAGKPGALMNDVAPIRWSKEAAERLAAWLDKIERNCEHKRGPHGVMPIDVTPRG